MCSCSTLLVYVRPCFPCIACLLASIVCLACLPCLLGWLTDFSLFLLSSMRARRGRVLPYCFPMICSIIPWTFMDPLCLIDFHRHRFALASIDCHRLLVPIMICLSFSLVCMHVHWLLMICIGFHWGSLILNASKGFIDFYWFTWIVIDFHSLSLISLCSVLSIYFHWLH